MRILLGCLVSLAVSSGGLAYFACDARQDRFEPPEADVMENVKAFYSAAKTNNLDLMQEYCTPCDMDSESAKWQCSLDNQLWLRKSAPEVINCKMLRTGRIVSDGAVISVYCNVMRDGAVFREGLTVIAIFPENYRRCIRRYEITPM